MRKTLGRAINAIFCEVHDVTVTKPARSTALPARYILMPRSILLADQHLAAAQYAPSSRPYGRPEGYGCHRISRPYRLSRRPHAKR